MTGGGLACMTGAALLCLQQAALADSSPCDPDSGLKQYIGSYDTDALLRDPRIDGPLRTLLGEQYSQLINNLDVRGSVDLVSGDLSLAGNAIHGGGLEEAVVCVSLFDGAVSAALYTQGKISVYSRDQDYSAQPLCIKDWITQVNSGHTDRRRIPDNTSMAPN
ncbi:MAG: hypothetical protein WBN40_02545 [Pseudomonadales bacterium]